MEIVLNIFHFYFQGERRGCFKQSRTDLPSQLARSLQVNVLFLMLVWSMIFFQNCNENLFECDNWWATKQHVCSGQGVAVICGSSPAWKWRELFGSGGSTSKLWRLMIAKDRQWRSIMVGDGQRWLMMANDRQWRSMMVGDGQGWLMMAKDRQWRSMMVGDGQGWLMMTKDRQWRSMMVGYGQGWFMIAKDRQWRSMMVGDGQGWLL